MTERQRRRRLVRIKLRAWHLERHEGPDRADLASELAIDARANKYAAASEWFASPGLHVIGGFGGSRTLGRPFWRGRW
jgi:hypothetical protein